MKYLLDTHVFLWYLAADEKLSEKAINAIKSEENQILISIASLWEISIKFSLGKLKLTEDLYALEQKIKSYQFHLLPITFPHILKQAELPLHHRDPFDRLIIAQSLVERMTLISRDNAFRHYTDQGLELIW